MTKRSILGFPFPSPSAPVAALSSLVISAHTRSTSLRRARSLARTKVIFALGHVLVHSAIVSSAAFWLRPTMYMRNWRGLSFVLLFTEAVVDISA